MTTATHEKFVPGIITGEYRERESETGFTIVTIPERECDCGNHILPSRDVEISRYRIQQQTGITVEHISKVFQGKRQASVVTSQLIARAIGVTMDELIWILRERSKYLSR